MIYIIYKDGVEVNRIVADGAYCQRFYSGEGHSYAAAPPEPEDGPAPEPTAEEVLSVLLGEVSDNG